MNRLWRLGFALALVLNVAILYLPVAVGPPSSLPFLDKVVHATSFALIAATGCLARVPLRVIVVLIIGQAVFSEIAQGTVTVLHRDGNRADAVADLVGHGEPTGVSADHVPPAVAGSHHGKAGE